jgi:hypothetical protein
VLASTLFASQRHDPRFRGPQRAAPSAFDRKLPSNKQRGPAPIPRPATPRWRRGGAIAASLTIFESDARERTND